MPAAKPVARAKEPESKPASKKPLQKKLAVGAAGDHFEREADQAARGVVHGSEGPAAITPTITSLGAQRTPAVAPRAREREDARRDSARVQRKPSSSLPRIDDEKSALKSAGKRAQREAADGASAGTVPASVESSIAQMKGGGHGLDGGARSAMESGLGRDFSGVRVHHDGNAADAAQSLGARAFTVGPDVFFNAGEYRPHTDSGRELIAHELTHTVQQGGAGGEASRQRVQRAKKEAPPKASPKKETDEKQTDPKARTSTLFTSKALPGAEVDTTRKSKARGEPKGTITLPQLKLPKLPKSLKGTAGGLVTPLAAEGRAVPVAGKDTVFELAPVAKRKTDEAAYQVWESYIKKEFGKDITARLKELVEATPDAPKLSRADAEDRVYFLRFDRVKTHAFFGTLKELAGSSALLRPQWDRAGSPLKKRDERLHADHFLELQIGGRDAGENMWLLRGSYNVQVGSQLKGNIEADLGKLLDELKKDKTLDKGPKSIEEMKRLWNLRFNSVVAGSTYPDAPKEFWTAQEIKTGKHLEALRVMSAKEVSTAGLRLGKLGVIPSEVTLYPTAAGGLMKPIELTRKGKLKEEVYLFSNNLFAESGQYQGDATDTAGGTLLTLTIVTNKKEKKTKKRDLLVGKRAENVKIPRVPQLGLAGYLSRDALMRSFGEMEFGPLSPLTFTDLAVSPEGVLMGTGSVLSSKALFPKLDVPLTLYDDTVTMDFPIPFERLSLGPLTVTEAALTLGVSPQGLFIAGSAGFMVTGLGTGTILAFADREGPLLKGTLDLDTNFLKKAQVNLQYELATDALTAGMNLEVERGRIPGVESDTVRVDINNDAVNVRGTVNLGAPLAGTALTVGYTKEEGLKIAAENVQLPFAKLPAVQNATMSLAATRRPDGTGWSFGGAGTATLAVPGAAGTIDLHYLDGQVTMTALGQVSKGPASGTINFTATNSPVDDQGNPTEGPPSDTIRAWGRGSVTVQFGPILRGTAVVELTEKNQIILTGTIALPAEFPVFDRISYHRELLCVDPPEFPIWGVSVAGVGVGIFAFVRGEVTFDAYVGAGVIRNAAITAVMDLDHPELATVHGQGEFYVPAYAGLTLGVLGGLRARAAVAFAEGEVGLEGILGIQADASAALDVDWNPTQGLSLETEVAANMRPKFRLDATASVKVGVDLRFTDVSHTFGPWRRSLGEFGPDMELGVSFPVRWSEASGLDLNLDNVAIRQPTLDGPALMRGVFDRMTD